MTSPDQTFYQSEKTARIDGAYAAAIVAAPDGSSGISVINAARGTSASATGTKWGACDKGWFSTVAGTDANAKLQTVCSSLVSWVSKDNTGDGTSANNKLARTVFNKTRMTMASSITTETEYYMGTDDIRPATAGTVDGTNSMKVPPISKDFVLGSFYQNTGTLAADTVWCSGSWFTELVAAGATNTVLEAGEGIGPKNKCTWQVAANSDDNGLTAPVMELAQMPTADAFIQVVEWYNQANLAAGAIINSANIVTGTSAIGSVAGAEYVTGVDKGVFFSPFEGAIADAEIQKVIATPAGVATNPFTNEPNAADNEPNSIGTAIYYEQSTGQTKEAIRSVDSLWISRSIAAYNGAVTAFNTAKSTYETNAKKYQAYLDSPSGTEVERPDLPSDIGDYTGYYLELASQQENTPTKDWTAASGSFKSSSTMALLATGGTAAAPTYTPSEVKSQYNQRVSYLQINSASTAFSSPTPVNVGHTFGRLGQAESTGLTGTPFFWEKPVTTAQPGF